ncbi:MAG: site-specific integrase [Prevotella sp.]|nr:site-specific integrase [Prevotella sp.]
MKYNVVFSAESRKDKKSGSIITKDVPIRMRVSFSGRRVEMSTGLKFDVDVWNDIMSLSNKDKRNQVPVSRRHRIDALLSVKGTDIHSLQKNLRELESRVDGVFHVFEALGKTPSVEDFKGFYDKKIGITLDGNNNIVPSNDSSAKTAAFWAAFDKFVSIKSIECNWGHTYIEKYDKLKKTLSKFRKDICFDTFTDRGITDFIIFLNKQERNCNSTASKKWSEIKRFLKWSYEKHYSSNPAASTYELHMKSNSMPVIHLSLEELQRLKEYELPENCSGQELSRDIFLFCCFTGMRFSDAANLRWENVSEGLIEFVTIKNNKRLRVELNDHSREILEKHRSMMKEPKGKVFPYRSDQQVNNDLKKICRKIGLDEQVNIVRYIGNKRFTITMRKCDAISTHAGRRTFICLAIELGIPPVVIREWTGHSTDKAMKPYISVTNKKKAREMSKFDSF